MEEGIIRGCQAKSGSPWPERQNQERDMSAVLYVSQGIGLIFIKIFLLLTKEAFLASASTYAFFFFARMQPLCWERFGGLLILFPVSILQRVGLTRPRISTTDTRIIFLDCCSGFGPPARITGRERVSVSQDLAVNGLSQAYPLVRIAAPPSGKNSPIRSIPVPYRRIRSEDLCFQISKQCY
jgi:hypothetical protein